AVAGLPLFARGLEIVEAGIEPGRQKDALAALLVAGRGEEVALRNAIRTQEVLGLVRAAQRWRHQDQENAEEQRSAQQDAERAEANLERRDGERPKLIVLDGHGRAPQIIASAMPRSLGQSEKRARTFLVLREKMLQRTVQCTDPTVSAQ